MISVFLFKVTILLLLFNHIFVSAFYFNSYGVALFIFIIAVLTNRRRRTFDLRILAIFLTIGATGLVHVLQFGFIPSGFLQATVVYLAIPFLAYVTSFSRQEFLSLVRFIALTSLLSLSGAIAYGFVNAGAVFEGRVAMDSENFVRRVFHAEWTATFGVVHTRNSSIYGSSLVFGAISLIQLSACLFLINLKHSVFINYGLASMSGLAALLSYARRVYPSGFLLVAFWYSFLNLKAKIFWFFILAFVLAFGFWLFHEHFFSLLQRITSTFSFLENSSGNQSRLAFMEAGIRNAFANPFGLGFGTTSSIGKEYNTIEMAAGFRGVTESFFITAIGEFGIAQFIFCCSVYFLRRNSLIISKRFLFFLLPFLLESVMGLSLLNPTCAVMVYLLTFSYVSKSAVRSSNDR